MFRELDVYSTEQRIGSAEYRVLSFALILRKV
jgi:hypothetical protein